jgi:hypothetical protein
LACHANGTQQQRLMRRVNAVKIAQSQYETSIG